MRTPLDAVKAIADKLIRETPFRYRLELAPCKHEFKNESSFGLQAVDFGRSFGLGRAGVAYALTQLTVDRPMYIRVEIAHNDGCQVSLNGKEVYCRKGDNELSMVMDERSIEMPWSFDLSLQAGSNTLLIKSETRGEQWQVCIQPPSCKGAVISDKHSHPEIGLRSMLDVDGEIAELTNWLIVGPFENPDEQGERCGLDKEFGPDKILCVGEMFEGRDGAVTWTIPKIEVLGNVIDPAPWGTNDMWNYHNGGVAWAMQHLADVSGVSEYAEYASSFCDFHLKGIPFVRHQVKTLNAVECANHFIIDTPLLDFTLAPSLPFINRLRREVEFDNREEYAGFIDRMLRYARDEQIRLPESGIYTRTTPVEYTTWVDDMFMGIPFLVQASQYVDDPDQRKSFLDDAARQALGFNSQVWDEEAQLYMHARYSGSEVNFPHWSRCNGWALWAMVELLQVLPEDHDCYEGILAQFKRHASSLLSLQNESGCWHNVLDRPDSPEEVSGTSIFVMAFARGVKFGWLDAEYRDAALRGWQAIDERINPEGGVRDICMGTMCSEDVEHYVNHTFYDDDTHGLFAVIFAGIAMHEMGEHG